ncbi:MAG: ATP synthase F0 subunit B [Proteobacteria bacterium]|nr:ATP synthase F0 subunit B [Pseudomonadota bacterium]MBU1581562.1 ATP synthase F0 subunit B [Pseudomonadota bacterium]MBU2452681.1 ATP synthase F0 subunit B [Pseudomonadota bacterium]MBU2630156.1 ATP synthase F0 subunit B [Pseudomonadota bacterium]
MKKQGRKKELLQGALLIVTFVFAVCGFAWASSEGGQGEVHNAWLLNDWWKVLNFGILAVAGFFIARKPVAEFFSSRAKSIEDEIKSLEQKKADAQKKLAEYQAKFKNLDQESKQIVEDYIKQGEEAKTRILAEAEAQAEKLEEMAKRSIEQEFKSAKAKLQQDIVEKAMEKAEEVIKASISPEDQDQLVDQYLKKVVA